MFSQTFLLAALLALISAADAQSRLFHRVHHPALQPPLAFSERGTLHIADSVATLEHSETYSDDLEEFASVLQQYPDALYQVAMDRAGEKDEARWDVSSVKACHLPRATAESIVLHLSPYDGKPFTLDYFVSPIPHDGSCPTPKKTAGSQSSFALTPLNNVTILLRSPTSPPRPELRAPPPLTPQGEPVKPPVEKSFIQKYWIYVAALLVALLIAPSPAEEGQGGEGGQARR
ncbi:hypothetical protein GLOTRDRAFT_109672 [Gloeophyllum trabeum ATCC 11539]|uniref:ER membrane protein complex subunit 10 n=1 Tax=Gloeophyllum trabeum (strain ATCC 11539 / FP-39264 / Madison 617) TaxID=670483 RepID=S7QJ54_GLOTA|nr:uncharacterized protein GLOTRDRAFT_109672 [Gloeophyllum trabeum ATCC 11539]EPQ59407.1 hypothetical protein GLOTRDRAFT_109672 [Gloeophyllum trabeum ATCC 11539]